MFSAVLFPYSMILSLIYFTWLHRLFLRFFMREVLRYEIFPSESWTISKWHVFAFSEGWDLKENYRSSVNSRRIALIIQCMFNGDNICNGQAKSLTVISDHLSILYVNCNLLKSEFLSQCRNDQHFTIIQRHGVKHSKYSLNI